MFNENHLRESLKKRFDFIDFNEWKDKFINIEFDLSVFHNQQKFIKYLVEQKYNFKDKINNIEMYITYEKESEPSKSHNYGADKLFNKDWVSYIDNFLDLLQDIEFNNRQLDMLCLRLSLALDRIGDGVKMPDYLMCLILKDMFKNIEPKRKKYNDVSFSYVDKNTKKAEHILKLFFGGESEREAETDKFLGKTNSQYHPSPKTTIFKHSKQDDLDRNKQVAKFAILANSQNNINQEKESENN